MLTGLLVAIAFGALTGVLWGALDYGFQRLTSSFVEETQITLIIRMVLAGFVAQNLATYAIAFVFHALPGGGILSLISIVLSILIYWNSRAYFTRGY